MGVGRTTPVGRHLRTVAQSSTNYPTVNPRFPYLLAGDFYIVQPHFHFPRLTQSSVTIYYTSYLRKPDLQVLRPPVPRISKNLSQSICIWFSLTHKRWPSGVYSRTSIQISWALTSNLPTTRCAGTTTCKRTLFSTSRFQAILHDIRIL